MSVELNPVQAVIVINALRVAADRYDSMASKFPVIAGTFTKQARVARKLATLIEQQED